MTTYILSMADLPAALRAQAKLDEEAVRHAVWRTASVDAHRWIQWSIRGGGLEKAPPQRTADVPKARPRATGKRSKKAPCPRRAPPAYRTPVDTGDYAASWRDELFDWGAEVYSSPSPPVKAGVIEEGRRPGKGIPLGPLADWVRRKLKCSNEKRARSIAFAISRHAKIHGRPGLHVLGRAHPKILEALQRNVRREIRNRKWRR